MQIRLSDITNLTDARYAAAEGFDWVGFNFLNGHPHFISALKAQEIKGWLSGPVYFGKFSGADSAEVQGICALLQLDAIEIPLETYQIDYFKAAPFIFLDAGMNEVGRLLEFESTHPELFGAAAWISLNPLTQKPGLPIFTRCHSLKDLDLVITSDPEGIDLAGTDELQPGLSDWESIDAIVSSLRNLK